jgi:hypothetical protein
VGFGDAVGYIGLKSVSVKGSGVTGPSRVEERQGRTGGWVEMGEGESGGRVERLDGLKGMEVEELKLRSKSEVD